MKLDADIYVSGHGPPLTKQELRARLETGIGQRVRIKTLVNRGMDLKQVKATLHEPKPTPEAAMFPSFTEDVYGASGS